MMSEPASRLDASMQSALDELQESILRQYPTTTFRVRRGEDDPTIVQLVAIVDIDDTDPVLDVVMERLLELQAAGLPIFVVTDRPLSRTMALRDASHAASAEVVAAPRG